MYKHLRRDVGSPSCVVQDPVTKEYIFSTEEQHRVMIKAWKEVFDKHKGKEDSWPEFVKKYRKYEKGLHDAPQDCPPAELLYARAQKASNESSAGSDGFAPRETKALPLAAWTSRRQVVQLMAKLGR